MRMASFLEYYLFDRVLNASGKSPARTYFEERVRAGAPDAERDALRAFTETIHGLFEVRKLTKDHVRLRELFSAKEFDVTERRQLAGLAKGDIIETRLIPFGGELLFSAAFCFHPKAASKSILREVKRRKKNEPHRSPTDLAWDCAKRALKADRYRQIAIEKIYEFESKTL